MQMNRRLSILVLAAVAAAGTVFAAKGGNPNETATFQGPKANTGSAIFYKVDGKSMLKVSDDFKVPDTPAPTWRVVDSKGNIYTLDAFKTKGLVGNSEKREVVVPNYVHDIAKVQVYCAWAQVLLGEASFPEPVK
jgi:hypothetical protein